MKNPTLKTIRITAVLALMATSNLSVRADEVAEWNKNMFQAALVAKTSPLITARVAAIVQASVFDAVNGIERRYTPIHVSAAAPRGASRRAAVVQAAYASLLKLYPAQKATLDAQRDASLRNLVDDPEERFGRSVERGIAWGQSVADAIWAWRSTDGFAPAPPPFLGGNAVGQWRTTPPGFLAAAGPQFAYMTPWAIESAAQFHPAGPPALTSDRYAADFNETKIMGRNSSPIRTADQTLACQFWNASSASYFWDGVAVALSVERGLSLSQTSHLLAVLNVAMADAAIACWEGKFTYVFWRPVTAIPLADDDGNSGTASEAAWLPLIVTPAHPEYPSGHSTVSGAAARVLAAYFGERSSITFDSDVMLGVTRSFTSFSAALDEIKNARIFGGIHFRSACDDGQVMGQEVADYVLGNALQRVHGRP